MAKPNPISKRCDFCKTNKFGVVLTRDKRVICEDCKEYHNFCEICGSLPVNNNVRNQLHFEEECFK